MFLFFMVFLIAEVLLEIPDINCKKFKAVLSPDKIALAGPLIVATREFFGRFSPSLKFHLTLILVSSCLKLSSNHFVPDNIAFSLTVKFALIVLSEMPFSILNDRSFLALSSFNALLTFALIN